MQMIVIEWEFVLGGWLLSGYRRNAAWCAAVSTFAGFACLSGYMGFVGVESCGCFGATNKTTPWLSFGVDVTALVFLVTWRPNESDFLHKVALETQGALPLAILMSIFVIIGLMIFSEHSSADGLFATIRGDALTARPAIVDVGNGTPGEYRESSIEVSNWSDQEARIFGGSTGCSFDILLDCPKTISPKSAQVFRVKYQLPDTDGTTTQKVRFWVLHSGRTVPIQFEIRGNTKPASE